MYVIKTACDEVQDFSPYYDAFAKEIKIHCNQLIHYVLKNSKACRNSKVAETQNICS